MYSHWLPAACAGVVTAISLFASGVAGAEQPGGQAAKSRFHHQQLTPYRYGKRPGHGLPAQVEVFAPGRGDRVGLDGRGWFIDLAVSFDTPLAETGFTLNADGEPGFQLTGPAVHDDVAPFPGTFSVGADERLPGLIVLLTTTEVGAGPCLNLANLFNLTGITDLALQEAEIWDTWIVGAPLFGVDAKSTLFVAVADELDGDGIYNDAPDVVPDTDGDGVCTYSDLLDLGVASNIEQVRFFINGPVDLSALPVVP